MSDGDTKAKPTEIREKIIASGMFSGENKTGNGSIADLEVELAKLKEAEAKKKETENLPEVRILIGVPILAWTHEFAMSFIQFWTDLMTYRHKGRRFHVGYRFMYRKPVHMAEEQLAELAVNSNCTHLLLMDDDIYDTTAEDLMRLVDAEKDVVGGIMHASGFPYAMCAFRRFDPKTKVADQPILEGPARLYEIPLEQRQGIQKVDLIPFAFTLIRTSVFKGLKKPWFICDNQAPTDSWFADSVLDAKMDYFAHFGVLLNHRGITFRNAHLWSQLHMVDQQGKMGPQMIVLTKEEMATHEAYMKQRLKDAETQLKEKAKTDIPFFEKKEGDKIGVPVVKPKPEPTPSPLGK